MSTLVGEVGALVAENVSEVLESTAGSEPGVDRSTWQILAEGGWGTISADPENGMELRDVLEVARISGRHPCSTPLITTLLAGRWFEVDDDTLEDGVAVAFARGDQVVAPFWTEGLVVLDGSGSPVAVEPSAMESFSLVAPVAVLPASTSALGGDHLAEARAAFVAVAVGCADAVIARAIDWSQTREQFGQTIKGFQAVRHHLANAHIAREQAWTAAIAAAHDPERSGRWARQGFSLAREAIELGIQVHGGVGFTWEVGLQHFLDEVVQLDSILGERR
ncbi:hypothetical protein GCM10010988_39580 [Cnuibacter physcomitrellae]|uniref:Uncharacterized protein n=1 Tax=Cnuibacter physcomitrellae TaxID=1619308 RepID=A0A1X9LSW0_9MICO|nr:acyl-CoA dehydrogenase family protein [Cnuibacter physcomitrellae]ARJ07512.1 hypothetical protein B5808_19105 [Cnuibacter physcomitrellae]GGI42546.1 hypothetical protein GCM10010988_39580 [Cnuibacter physcomitrellae]